MKKLLFFFVTIALLSSCKKDETGTDTSKVTVKTTITPSQLVGKWYYTLDTIKENVNGGAFKIRSTVKYNRKEYIQFNADGTGSEFYNEVLPFTYTVKGNVLTFNHPEATISTGGGPLTFPAYSQSATIRSVTSTEFNMLYYEPTVNGANTTITYEAQYFSK
jgi:hypothetical protein